MKLKKLKTPTTYVPKRGIPTGVTRKQELELRRMARLVPDETYLVHMMAQVAEDRREACLSRIKPYLPFKLPFGYTLPLTNAAVRE